MVSCRLDPRLAPRIDPSDVVQDVLVEANRRLLAYVRTRPLPFYPWLRQIAVDQIGMTHRRHIRAARRSIHREEPAGLPDASAYELAGRLMDTSSGPSARRDREERRVQLRAALDRLPNRDREILALRYLEQLRTAEVASILQISEAAVKMRLLRAIQRFHKLVNQEERP
jgi:RNA polymerase sigma-70 factor (ECF subfamily)